MSISTHTTHQGVAMDGVLVVNKDAGWTSHDVVAKVRGLLGGIKVGHAGTLDPAATGVLPVLVGRATRVAEYLIDWDKEYRAVLRLGETTDTQDATGNLLGRVDISGLREETLRETVACFRGRQRQMPPMYSAVKVRGKPLYKAARAGKTVDRAERTIVIHALDILAIDGPDVTLNIVCSKGTYIRTLCADIGRALGVGGHLHALERRRVGPLSIDHALTVGEVQSKAAIGTLRECLLPLNQVLDRLPVLVISDEQARFVLNGRAFFSAEIPRLASTSSQVSIRLEDKNRKLLAIGTYDAQTAGPIKIHKVLADSGSSN